MFQRRRAGEVGRSTAPMLCIVCAGAGAGVGGPHHSRRRHHDRCVVRELNLNFVFSPTGDEGTVTSGRVRTVRRRSLR